MTQPNHHRLTVALVCLPLVVLLGCTPDEPPVPTPTDNADVATIHALVQQSVLALNTNDIETLLALHTEDAVILKPHRSPEIGKEVMRSSLEVLFRQFEVNESRDIAEVQIAGEWAFAWGTYRSKLTPRSGGEPLVETGKYIEVLRRQLGGGWKTARTIWNTSNPKQ